MLLLLFTLSHAFAFNVRAFYGSIGLDVRQRINASVPVTAPAAPSLHRYRYATCIFTFFAAGGVYSSPPVALLA